MAGTSAEVPVAIVGGGVVGAAIAHALARRGVGALVLEAEDEPARGASGTNSGILHAAFDSAPGELETALILRSAALRDAVIENAGIPVLRCGATVTPRGDEEARTVAALADTARANGVRATLRADGALDVPGEAVTDPVAYTRALTDGATAAGAEIRTGARVEAIRRADSGLELMTAAGDAVACRVAINCAGLHADDVARLAGDESFAIFPRKGEFLVFDPPAGQPLERILLPVPTKRTKGVLVFPTVDGKVVAGPTAHDQTDKGDWSVRERAREEILPRAVAMLPSLEGAEPIASWAGLRPAGRGCNYVIGPSRACPGLINVAAIRSTGLSASLGIAEHVLALVAREGLALGPEAPLPQVRAHASAQPWWLRAARRGAELP
jgi:glycerol-3-phosphate dehydrogenase